MATYKLSITFNDYASVEHPDVTNLKIKELSQENFSDLDLRGAYMVGMDLSKMDFTKKDLSYAVLENANLTKANLSGVNLTKANLKNANLSEANLGETVFYGADLTNATLNDASFVTTTNKKTNFDEAILIGAKLPEGFKESDTVSCQNACFEQDELDTKEKKATAVFTYTPMSDFDASKSWQKERSFATSVDFPIENHKQKGRVDLVSINTQKEMYSHNWVDFVLLFSCVDVEGQTGTDITIEEWLGIFLSQFNMAKVDLALSFDPVVEGKTQNFKDIASSYLIFDYEPEYQSGSSSCAYVKFRAYSPDKLLSMRSFCKAYTGKRLFDTIVKEQLAEFDRSIDHNYFKWENHYEDNFTVLRSSKLDYIHPYLVQYNEDFYRFLVRTLNRSGEFLYYEDGKLHFGCKNALYDPEHKVSKEPTDEPIVIDEYISYNCKHFGQAYSYDKLTCEGFSNNYYDEALKDDVLNEKQQKSPMKDILVYHNRSSKPFVTNSVLGINEHIMTIEQGKCTSLLEFRPLDPTILAGIEGALDKRDMSDMIYYLIDFLGIQTYVTYWGMKLKNDQCDDKHFKPDGTLSDAQEEKWNSVENKDTYDDRLNTASTPHTVSLYTDRDNTCLSVINDTTGESTLMFTPKYYDRVKRGIENSERQRIRIRLGSPKKHFSLGSLIQFKNKTFLIVKIENNCFSRLLDEETYSNVNTIRSVLGKTGNAELRALAYRENSHFRHTIEDCVIEAVMVEKGTFTFPTDSHCPAFINPGPQRAFITDIMDPKKMNRVRIRYAWQKASDMASPWVRLCSPMATAKGGFNMLPNVGDEAVVNYEHDNIEAPFVEGMVYNEARSPKFSHLFGGARSISSANGHTIKFDDNPLSGNAWASSFFPLLGTMTSFMPYRIKGSSDLKAGGITMNDNWGMYKIMMSADKRMILIDSPLGSVTLHAFTGINIVAPNGNIKIMGKNVDIIAGNKLTMTSGANLKTYWPHSGEREVEQIKDFAKKVFSTSLSPVDMTFLRTLYEALLRPISGTLKLKASRYLMMETGPATCKIPDRSWMYHHNKVLQSQNTKAENFAAVPVLFSVFGIIKEICVSYVREREIAINVFNNIVRSYSELWGKLLNVTYKDQNKGNDLHEKLTYTTILKDLEEKQYLQETKLFKSATLKEYKELLEEGYEVDSEEWIKFDKLSDKQKGLYKESEKPKHEKVVKKNLEAIDTVLQMEKISDALDNFLEDTWVNLTDERIQSLIEKPYNEAKEVRENIEKNKKTAKTAADKETNKKNLVAAKLKEAFLKENLTKGKNTYNKLESFMRSQKFKWTSPYHDFEETTTIPKEKMHDFYAEVLNTSVINAKQHYWILPDNLPGSDTRDFMLTGNNLPAWFKKFEEVNTVQLPNPEEYGKLAKVGHFVQNMWGWDGIKEDRVWSFTHPNSIMFTNKKGKTFELDAETGNVKEVKDWAGFENLAKNMTEQFIDKDIEVTL